jgi:CDP-glucose 4,6-dehydratase
MNAGADWAGRKALVTGATGIVGSWLVKDLLARGAQVVALVFDLDPRSEVVRSGDLDRCAIVNGRLEDADAVERAIVVHEVDSVFHLGAQTLVGAAHRAPLVTWEANVRGTYVLLEACRRHADVVRRVVIASSDKAYGETDLLPTPEDVPLRPRHPYEVSKACADLIAQSYAFTYGLPVAVARCGNVYGGGDLNWSRIVPGTIRALLRGERPVLRSDGRHVRDYVYVRDVAAAYVALADAIGEDGVAGEAFNFSDESPRTVLEIVGEISRQLERDDLPPVVLDEAVGEIRAQALDASKARRILDWEARWDLASGLAETIAWYRDHLASHEGPVPQLETR